MEKKQVIETVTKLMDDYCTDCFLKKHFKKEFGKTYAHSFCINKCTVGQKVKHYGSYLQSKEGNS
ncbi:zinc-finger domain-containing protein [Bacillus carboniphilus]|uniref:Zinc-finger domain-containing protein n=1 Tax=Bacillus carboniphilus TaxID=86663 RepID=A0ABY9JWB3_9BACI|nr:zinc-finger domain-containing protein [Bacillus carboniphilus]WLR43684.1 zinc-finger domain-containing protein [Bacillus carboniphilus]